MGDTDTGVKIESWLIGTKIEFLALGIGALLLMLIAPLFLFRVGAPTALYIARVNGTGRWSLILHRTARQPVVRQLHDLEAYLETFGYCNRFNFNLPFNMKKLGYSTSSSGTVHLLFMRSSAGPAL